MISVIVATYGDREWEQLGQKRAHPSAISQAVQVGDHWRIPQVISAHFGEGTIAASRNTAATQATGDWLCFLDADDELAPGYIGAMQRAIEQEANATRLLFTPAVQIVRPNRTPGPATFFRQVPLRQANWLVVGTLIHRDLFWEVGGFDDYPHGLEDWALWSKCARVGASVVKVPDAVYRYWANPDSMHRQLWRDKANQRAEHRRVARELDEWEKARV